MKIAFNQSIGGTNGRTDAMRVVDSTGNVPNDLDARVLYSSNWPSVRVEKKVVAISGMSSSIARRTSIWDLSRTYSKFPYIIGALNVTRTGQVIYPYYKTVTWRYKDQSGGTKSISQPARCFFRLMTTALGSGKYRVTWEMENYGLMELEDGNLIMYALSKAGS